MKYIFLLLISIFTAKNYEAIIKDNTAFREEMNAEFRNPEESPLTKEDLATFTELPFYAIDTAFYIIANFERAVDAKPFEMKTTTSRKPIYEVYGTATFIYKGKTHTLQIYQNHQLRETEKYANYLFLPFTDLSSGQESYPGGRFIDLSIPENDSIVIDFNKAYNPLCAYNAKYSCPIPPAENHLEIEVKAGVKYGH